MDENLNDLRLKLLQAAMSHISLQGWTKGALILGAQDAGVDPALAPYIFPNGGASAYEFFMGWLNKKLISQTEDIARAKMPMHEKIEECLCRRLKLCEPYKSALYWSRQFHRRPKYTLFSSMVLYEIVDTIWFICGDKSLDWNFYTKRGLLAVVYVSVSAIWLGNPKNYSIDDMRPIIREKLRQVMKISKFKTHIRKVFETVSMGPFRKAS